MVPVLNLSEEGEKVRPRVSWPIRQLDITIKGRTVKYIVDTHGKLTHENWDLAREVLAQISEKEFALLVQVIQQTSKLNEKALGPAFGRPLPFLLDPKMDGLNKIRISVVTLGFLDHQPIYLRGFSFGRLEITPESENRLKDLPPQIQALAGNLQAHLENLNNVLLSNQKTAV